MNADCFVFKLLWRVDGKQLTRFQIETSVFKFLRRILWTGPDFNPNVHESYQNVNCFSDSRTAFGRVQLLRTVDIRHVGPLPVWYDQIRKLDLF